MRLGRADLSAAFAIFKRDSLVFLSYRTRFIAQIASGFVTLVLFYYISRLVNVSTFDSPDEYFAFVVVGLVVMEVLASALHLVPAAIRQELVAGTFERLVLSPFGAVAAVVAMLLFPVVGSLVSGAIMVAFGGLVFDMPIAWTTAPLSIPVLLLGAVAFVPFALLIAALVLLVKQAPAGAAFVVTGLSLIGGFFFPVSLLPNWIQWTSEVQPFTPTLDLLRHLLVGSTAEGSAWAAVVKLAVFAIVLLPPSLWALRGSLTIAQQRGTVIEY
jgi:ABC-2 type transport system permease protein